MTIDVKDLSILTFWYLCGVLESSPMDNTGLLYLVPVSTYLNDNSTILLENTALKFCFHNLWKVKESDLK